MSTLIVHSIVHKVKLSRGIWYTTLRTKNAFGASKMSAEHEVTVVTSESVQQAGILSFGNYYYFSYFMSSFIAFLSLESVSELNLLTPLINAFVALLSLLPLRPQNQMKQVDQ